MEENKINLKWR